MRTAPEELKLPSQDRIRMSIQENAKERFRDLSQQVHSIDRTMSTLDRHLGDMRKSLEKIVKQYPPYPPESAERIENLRRFNALRKIIEQLTFPHKENDPDIITENRNQVVGPDAISLPEIGPKAEDGQIAALLEKVKGAQYSHRQKHQRFIAEANEAIDQIG